MSSKKKTQKPNLGSLTWQPFGRNPIQGEIVDEMISIRERMVESKDTRGYLEWEQSLREFGLSSDRPSRDPLGTGHHDHVHVSAHNPDIPGPVVGFDIDTGAPMSRMDGGIYGTAIQDEVEKFLGGTNKTIITQQKIIAALLMMLGEKKVILQPEDLQAAENWQGAGSVVMSAYRDPRVFIIEIKEKDAE